MNMQDLLGKIFQSDITPSGNDRLKNAMGQPQGATEGGGMPDLGGILDQLKGLQGSEIIDRVKGAAGEMYGQTKEGVQGGNPLAVGGLAALAGAILGGGRGALGGAVGAGALAILAKVAYEAMQKNKGAATQGELPLGLRDPETPAEEKVLEARAGLVLQAMINAAKADGDIDKREMDKISGKLEELGADKATIDFVHQKMQGPADLMGLVRAVPDTETGMQVYAASLLAIEVDTPAERDYLKQLSSGLKLDPTAVATVHKMLGVAA
ncbi:MAG: tellurite resistance TerB family protein [Chitinophagales bacterium]|nr:tellurite resistance TerB family protein [Hyphomicrobiales bacterium]